MEKILYIDTSGKFSTILLLSKTTILASKYSDEINAHAKNVHLHVQEIFSETSTSWSEVAAVAVLNGPGSYTGLRIGLSSAKGYCYAHDIPLILINRFQLMNNSQNGPFNKGFLILARENEFFFQPFSAEGKEIEEASLVNSEEIANFKKRYALTLFSDEDNLQALFDEISIIRTNSTSIQNLVFEQFLNNNFVDLMHSEPFYLKKVHINKINKL